MADVAEKKEEIGAGDAPLEPAAKKVESTVDEVQSATEPPKSESDGQNSDASSATESPNKATATPHDSSITKQEANIIRQIEYYFGDENLRRDKFLLEQISKDEDGWVPFSVLLTFKRLAAISTDVEVITNALMKSDEGLIEINEDKLKIRRHPEKPIPEYNEERRKEIASRTAYAKGFPLDSEMSDLIDFFNPYDKVVNIVMRKYLDKPTKTYKFKGSVFVTFAKKEQCEEFIAKEKVEYKEKDLIRMWQEQYLEDKKKEERGSKKKSKQKEKEEEKFDLPKGAILKFEGCDENTTRELIREKLEKFVTELGTEIAYIEYNKGEKGGYVRLTIENIAEPLLEKLEDKKLQLNNEVQLEFSAVTGEDETEFLKKAIAQMKQRRGHQNKNRSNRKRRGSEKAEEEPPIKQKN